MNTGRSLIALAVLALGGATACNSTPSADRVALDMIDALSDSSTPEPVKACMRKVVEDFNREPFADLDEISKKADDQVVEAEAAMADFRALLRGCVI